MIHTLYIKNLALIDQLELNFEKGFNVITGETGAGKSVITGAVGLILGNRVDKTMIRHGCDRCELAATFEFPLKSVKGLIDLLDDASIEWKDEHARVALHIRRVITPTSTKNFVNDSAVTAQILSQIADLIIDVHAANEHFSLHNVQKQLDLLDRFADTDDAKKTCAEIVNELKKLRAEREQQLAECPSRNEIEHLKITLQEIESAHITPGEEADIIAKHTLVANSCEISEIVAQVIATTTESESSVRDTMSDALRAIERLGHLDPDNAEIFRNLCTDIISSVSELSREMERYGHRLEVDEQQLQMLSDRLAVIQRIKRRYGPSLQEVNDTLENARRRLHIFEDSEQIIAQFTEHEKKLLAQLSESCKILHQKREAAAQRLDHEVSALLQTLGFAKAQFTIQFHVAPEGPNGADQIEMCFAANPGEGMGPLRAIASSGEISRVMLALKAVLSEADTLPILLFDEIDVNIGGETAGIVGNELKKLATKHQIICISHLPQVAVCADNHIAVGKKIETDRTFTFADRLNEQGRLHEIARMLGGGKAATAHAKALLDKETVKPDRCIQENLL